jgi:hypothetical protein
MNQFYDNGRRKSMRNGSLKYIGSALVLAMIAMISIPTLGQNISRSLEIKRAAKIAGQSIAPGKYTVEFDEKKDGELALTKEGKQVLKASYKLTELDKAPADSAVVFTAASDGSLSIRRIEMKGMKTALQFE